MHVALRSSKCAPTRDRQKRSVLFLHTKTSHRSRLPIGRAGREMRVGSSESHLCWRFFYGWP